jgi:flagellar biosynthesis/type III secretory pathway M-ring protein FliF/YscJ
MWRRYAPQAVEGVRLVIPLALGLVALLFVIRPVLRRLLEPPDAVAAANQLPSAAPRTIQDLEGEIEAQLDAELAGKSAEHRKLPVLSRRLSAMTTREPEHAARLLRMWMAEDATDGRSR